MTLPARTAEAQRILAEYDRRRREIPPDFYALTRPANLFLAHGQERALVAGLVAATLLPLDVLKILEVGCGGGQWLAIFERLGANRRSLAGIDLDPERVATCAERFPGADVRAGDATALPWADASFDVVFQSTLFTSILDSGMKAAVAAEMLRVLRPHGAILWYDFVVDNPSNPNVKGIRRRELRALFAGCDVTARRVTLAPPLARRVAPAAWALGWLLEALVVLNTHDFAVIRPPAADGPLHSGRG